MRSIRIVKALALLAVVSAASSAQAADERLSYFGYFRVSQGAQLSGNKGTQTMYELGGAPSHFRLGNEHDWAEFGWSVLAYKGEDGTVGHAVVMLGGSYSLNTLGTNGTGFGGYLGSGGPAFQQLYVDLAKIPGIDATLWAGKKYYKREYSSMNDMFYWSNQGYGAGIEDIVVAEKAKVSYAILNASNSAADNAYLHDLRLKVDVVEGGSVQAGIFVLTPMAAEHLKLKAGVGGCLQYVQSLMGGSNQLAFQYEKGNLATSGQFGVGSAISYFQSWDNAPISDDRSKMRIIDNIDIKPMKDLELEAVAIYQLDKVVKVSTTAIEIGARVSYAVATHVQLLLEAGYDNVKADTTGAIANHLVKVTPAIELCAAPGNVPRLRLYMTYASWNKEAVGSVKAASYSSNASGIGPRPTDTSGVQVGVQGEAWF